MLLVVAESSGSSPGRQGYKMAVGAGGELIGSIGGGVMEVNLVEQSRAILSEPPPSASGHSESSPPYEGGVAEGRGGSLLITQVHRKNSPNASGMICSGRQTVIFRRLLPDDAKTVDAVIETLTKRRPDRLIISRQEFSLSPSKGGTQNSDFHLTSSPIPNSPTPKSSASRTTSTSSAVDIARSLYPSWCLGWIFTFPFSTTGLS